MSYFEQNSRTDLSLETSSMVDTDKLVSTPGGREAAMEQFGVTVEGSEHAQSMQETTLSAIRPKVLASVASPEIFVPTTPKKALKFPRWRNEFVYIRNEGLDVKVFHSRTQVPYSIIMVITVSGNPDCLASTKKQWETTITKENRKVPEAVKAAVLHRFGTVFSSEERRSMKRSHWKRLEKKQSEHFQDLPVPLEEYARKRQEAIRLARRPEVTEEEIIDGVKKSTETFRPVSYSGNDFSYMDRAANETLNDSEYVKGVGIVPINRQYPQITETETSPVQNESLVLSPENFAYRDCDFPISQVLLSSGEIFESQVLEVPPVNPKDDANTSGHDIILQWRGKSGHSITICKNKKEIFKVGFEGIRRVNYNAKQKKLLLCLRNREVLVTLADHVTSQLWMILQTCCYKVIEGKGKDMSGLNEDFFKQKLESFLMSPKKNAKCSGRTLKHKQNRVFKPQEHKSSPLANLPTFSPAYDTPSKNQKSSIRKQKLLGLKEAEEHGGGKNSEDESDGSIDDIPQVKRRIFLPQKLTLTRTPSKRLYYDRKYTSEISPKRVCSNDRVVRIRSGENRNDGKRNRYDVFDGPWRIKKFDIADNIHGLEDSYDEESMLQSPRTYDKENWGKMLKTKVMLDFPSTSIAGKWVEIGQLIPLVGTQKMLPGSVFDSCLSVAQLPEFQRLKDRMIQQDQNEATGSYNDDEEDRTVVSTTKNDDQGALLLAQIKKDQFVAVIEIGSQGVGNDNLYEVEKLRKKRIRIYTPASMVVKSSKLRTDNKDPWIHRIMMARPELLQNHIAISEYLVHWAGWPDEDDTWEVGFNNIPVEFIKEFDMLTDPFRGVPLSQTIENPEALVFADDLAQMKRSKRWHHKNSKKSGIWGIEGNAKNEQTMSPYVDNHDLDSGDENLAKAIQASMKDLHTENPFEFHHKNVTVTDEHEELPVFRQKKRSKIMSQEEADVEMIDDVTPTAEEREERSGIRGKECLGAQG